MQSIPSCPKCSSEYTYQDSTLFICPQCGYEWLSEELQEVNVDDEIIKDAYGQVLQSGDTISIIKDLKIKGSSSIIKIGTKVKNIRLVSGDHNIDCKIDGIGPMKLKSQFVKKI